MRILTTVMCLFLSAEAATAQQHPMPHNIVELCGVDTGPFDFGKFRGQAHLVEGHHLTIEQKGLIMNEIIPCIESAIQSGQYEAILFEGEADSTIFVGVRTFEDDAIRQLEVAAARSYVVGRLTLRQLAGKYPAAWFRWTVSLGDDERVVRLYGVKKGVTLDEVERLLRERFDDHEQRLLALEGRPIVRDRTEEVLDAIRKEGDVTRGHVTGEHEKTRRVLNTRGVYILSELLVFPDNMSEHYAFGIGYSLKRISGDIRYHRAFRTHIEDIHPHVGNNIPIPYEGTWHGAQGSIHIHPFMIRPPEDWGWGWKKNLKLMPYGSFSGGIMARYITPLTPPIEESWDFRQEFPLWSWEIGLNLRIIDLIEIYAGGGQSSFEPPKLDRSTRFNEEKEIGGFFRTGLRVIR